MTTLEPGARLDLTQVLRSRPRSTAFLATSPAATITKGFEVFVQEVIAAITTAPWSRWTISPSSSHGIPCVHVGTVATGVAATPAPACRLERARVGVSRRVARGERLRDRLVDAVAVVDAEAPQPLEERRPARERAGSGPGGAAALRWTARRSRGRARPRVSTSRARTGRARGGSPCSTPRRARPDASSRPVRRR